MKKTELIQALADDAGITKAQAKSLLGRLAEIAESELRSEGEFTLPGVVRLKLQDKPATQERQGINPFTKAPVTIPAKPASKKVRALPASTLKKALA